MARFSQRSEQQEECCDHHHPDTADVVVEADLVGLFSRIHQFMDLGEVKDGDDCLG